MKPRRSRWRSTTLPSGTKVQLDATTPYSTKKGETGKTNITINLAEGSWSNFDFIFANFYKTSNSTYPDTYNFIPGEPNLVINVDTNKLYSDDYYVDVYGVKNNLKTTQPGNTTIEKFTDSSHDNVLPTAYLSRPSFDYYTFNMSDVGSSPKSAYLLLKSGEKLPIIEPGSTEFTNIQIPVKTMEKLAKYDIDVYEDLWHRSYKCYSYYFEMEDTEKNSCIAKIQGKPIEENKGVSTVSKPSNSSSNTWEFSFKRSQQYIQIKRFYKSSGNIWNIASGLLKEETFSDSSSKTYSGITDNCFIKVITANKNIGTVYHYSNPQYFYTGTQNTGTFDYMLEYSNTEMLIASDAPVLVETVATNKPYEECKALTVNDWGPDNDEFRSYEGKKNAYIVLPLSASNAGPAKYTIPLAEMDKRSEFDGYNCYVVIAHLANGKTLMSEVKQR